MDVTCMLLRLTFCMVHLQYVCTGVCAVAVPRTHPGSDYAQLRFSMCCLDTWCVTSVPLVSGRSEYAQLRYSMCVLDVDTISTSWTDPGSRHLVCLETLIGSIPRYLSVSRYQQGV